MMSMSEMPVMVTSGGFDDDVDDCDMDMVIDIVKPGICIVSRITLVRPKLKPHTFFDNHQNIHYTK
jgi:hypothetical protein